MNRIWDSSCGEDYILHSYERYGDFFVFLSSVEPIDKFDSFNEAALLCLRKSISNGSNGVLLTPTYGQFKSNNRRVYPFYELAQRGGIIVQFHHGENANVPVILSNLKYTEFLV